MKNQLNSQIKLNNRMIFLLS